MTDEELISYRDDVREFMIAENEADTRIFQDVSKELISRLERGRKAIDAMEELSKELGIICVEVLQGKYEGIRDFANAYPITFDEGTPMVRYLTEDRTDYQQSKEAADGD